jgi:uncharacterized tellurite resistance protein B-like protein
MLDRLFALLGRGIDRPEAAPSTDDLQRAAAVLLAIAARLDGRTGPAERQTIRRMLQERLGVTDADADGLLEDAEAEAADSTDFYRVTRIIKDRLDVDGRVSIIEMLWEVAYADGAVHDYEANLVRRVAGLLHVDDRAAGEARKRVTEKPGN